MILQLVLSSTTLNPGTDHDMVHYTCPSGFHMDIFNIWFYYKFYSANTLEFLMQLFDRKQSSTTRYPINAQEPLYLPNLHFVLRRTANSSGGGNIILKTTAKELAMRIDYGLVQPDHYVACYWIHYELRELNYENTKEALLDRLVPDYQLDYRSNN